LGEGGFDAWELEVEGGGGEQNELAIGHEL